MSDRRREVIVVLVFLALFVGCYVWMYLRSERETAQFRADLERLERESPEVYRQVLDELDERRKQRPEPDMEEWPD